MTGRFITLEGGEGVGKSTQLKALAEAITARGHNVITTREPGGTQGAEDIRALLMAGDDARWSARTEALLFAAARADHVGKRIYPALARGDWVLCDRFVDSTRAYQGGAGGVSDAEIMALHSIGSEGLLPNRTLLLDFPVQLGIERTYGRDMINSDRMGSKSSDYYERVAMRFREMAAQDPARFRTIDASGSISEITSRLIAAIEDLI